MWDEAPRQGAFEGSDECLPCPRKALGMAREMCHPGSAVVASHAAECHAHASWACGTRLPAKGRSKAPMNASHAHAKPWAWHAKCVIPSVRSPQAMRLSAMPTLRGHVGRASPPKGVRRLR